MSRDQKPAKMRVISGEAQAPHPLRRAGEREPAIAPIAPVAVEPARGKGLLLPLLYLACCAIGGVAVVLLMRTFAA